MLSNHLTPAVAKPKIVLNQSAKLKSWLVGNSMSRLWNTEWYFTELITWQPTYSVLSIWSQTFIYIEELITLQFIHVYIVSILHVLYISITCVSLVCEDHWLQVYLLLSKLDIWISWHKLFLVDELREFGINRIQQSTKPSALDWDLWHRLQANQLHDCWKGVYRKFFSQTEHLYGAITVLTGKEFF